MPLAFKCASRCFNFEAIKVWHCTEVSSNSILTKRPIFRFWRFYFCVKSWIACRSPIYFLAETGESSRYKKEVFFVYTQLPFNKMSFVVIIGCDLSPTTFTTEVPPLFAENTQNTVYLREWQSILYKSTIWTLSLRLLLCHKIQCINLLNSLFTILWSTTKNTNYCQNHIYSKENNKVKKEVFFFEKPFLNNLLWDFRNSPLCF